MTKLQLKQKHSPLPDEPPRSTFVSEGTQRLNRIIAFTASLVLTATMAQAQQIGEDPGTGAGGVVTNYHKTVPLYSAHELSLDLAGSYIAGQRGIEHLFETSIKGARGTWGGDVGLNYFITRNIGVGADVNMSDNGGNLVDAVLGNLTLRLPLGNSGFAPYVLGGGGRTTDHTWEWAGQAGVGIEFRPSHIWGIFTDARYVWPQHSSDALLLRAGIRIVF
jgi:hypothetical protein